MKTNTDSELVRFAKVELDRLLKNTEPGTDEYTMQKAANDDILDVIKVFAGHGDSGFSAAYKLSILEDLLRFSPVSPLTGDGDEWNEVGALSDDGKKSSTYVTNMWNGYDQVNMTADTPDDTKFNIITMATKSNCSVASLTRDRSQAGRNGGRQLSELILFSRLLEGI